MLKLTRRILSQPLRQVWRLLIFIVGGTVLLVGIARLFLPGPAFLVIPAGLGILAIEFAWARSLLKKARGFIQNSAHHRKTGQEGAPREQGGKPPG